MLGAGRILEVQMSQTLPAATDSYDFNADLVSAIYDTFDHGIQAGNITAAREDTYSGLRQLQLSYVG